MMLQGVALGPAQDQTFAHKKVMQLAGDAFCAYQALPHIIAVLLAYTFQEFKDVAVVEVEAAEATLGTES